jgi:hypothetical protein
MWALAKTSAASGKHFAAQKFSLPNKIAHNLLRQDKTGKLGIHGKRLKAGGGERRSPVETSRN